MWPNSDYPLLLRCLDGVDGMGYQQPQGVDER
eukprot:CAMPEP_0202341790 /NCGR_PEP_ID=MMETSP1126-20121109/2628_1 /ASSEMBLY_ACC=CAM_ASM_000457 /TAXON_ID=3047 /ORGANISM="Dunaliella tertiolecta, Strain CCMP1320" /LENGTH=31 /DNA_ID= /DNA_START= /DNA_END= /DNA_ORIENTATION=